MESRATIIKAFSLLEILIVIIMVAILVALALPRFGVMKEKAVVKEVEANLKLIQAAGKMYRMKTGSYYPISGQGDQDVDNINADLGLFLPDRNWDYTIADTGNLNVTATRLNPPEGWSRTYHIDADDDKACCCPQDPAVCPEEDWCPSCPP